METVRAEVLLRGVLGGLIEPWRVPLLPIIAGHIALATIVNPTTVTLAITERRTARHEKAESQSAQEIHSNTSISLLPYELQQHSRKD